MVGADRGVRPPGAPGIQGAHTGAPLQQQGLIARRSVRALVGIRYPLAGRVVTGSDGHSMRTRSLPLPVPFAPKDLRNPTRDGIIYDLEKHGCDSTPL